MGFLNHKASFFTRLLSGGLNLKVLHGRKLAIEDGEVVNLNLSGLRFVERRK